jgi:general secretion pathway protein F
MFRFVARDARKNEVRGSLNEASLGAAVRVLERRGLVPVDVWEADGAPRRSRGLSRSKRPPAIGQVAESIEQLQMLLESGIRLPQALTAVAASSANGMLADAFERSKKQIEEGRSLHAALLGAQFPAPTYVLNLVQAGEASGQLGESLRHGVAQLRADEQVRTTVVDSLLYPAILIAASALALMVIFVFVVPRFSRVLDGGHDLPLLAWLVLTTGVWVKAHLVHVLLGLAALAAVGLFCWRSDPLKARLKAMIAVFPVLGGIWYHLDFSRWAGQLGRLLSGRVPILLALQISARGASHPAIVGAAGTLARQVEAGRSVSDALAELSMGGEVVSQIVAVGERAGDLGAALQRLAELWSMRTQRRIKRLLALLEPALILAVGGMIALIMSGVILAITATTDIGLG